MKNLTEINNRMCMIHIIVLVNLNNNIYAQLTHAQDIYYLISAKGDSSSITFLIEWKSRCKSVDIAQL